MKNLKKGVVTVLISSLLLVNTTYAKEINTTIAVNNTIQAGKIETLNESGYTLIGFRKLFEMLDIKVDWNFVKREITAKDGSTTLIINVDTNEATLNGQKVNMEANIKIINGTTYIPLRFACESFGIEVDWKAEDKRINLKLQDKDTSNDKDEYTFNEALILEMKNNDTYKKIANGIKILEEQREINNKALKSVQINNSSQYKIYLNLAGNEYKFKQQYDISKERVKLLNNSIKFKLIANIQAINTLEANIKNLYEMIDINEKELNALELKYKYGLISKNSIEKARNDRDIEKTNLEELEISLDTQKQALKDDLNIKDYKAVNINFDVKFDIIDSINLEHQISKSLNSNPAIKILISNTNTQKVIYEDYTDEISDLEEMITSQNLKDLKKEETEAKDKMEQDIKNSYNELLMLKSKNDNLKETLNNVLSTYNEVVLKYNQGEVTEIDVEKAKMQVQNVKQSITQNDYKFVLEIFKFYNPDLL